MRIRTAKQRAQRIDLYYFRHATGMRRWRLILSALVPLAALLWVSGVAMAGGRKAYTPGPVSSAHAFAEMRCEVCHRAAGVSAAAAVAGARNGAWFRVHASDAACVTCHDAPEHAANMTPAPSCASCHEEHRGRVPIARTSDSFCIQCHGDLKTTHGDPRVAKNVRAFPASHPEFAAVKAGAEDPGRVRFNHAVHLNEVRGPSGPEQLECSTCHTPEMSRAAKTAKGPPRTGLMAPVNFQQHCARCHPLFFDERIEQPAPHVKPEAVRGFVEQSLAAYIHDHPGDISRPDSAFRRVPLNFPRPPELPARNAQEWVARRIVVDERILWNKTCAECHQAASASAARPPASTAAAGPLPQYAPTNITRQWMPRAGFDHTPHLMVTCQSCHAAQASTRTSDVLLPAQATCASCHSPAKGAESRCFECHRYHDWSKTHPVTPAYSLTDFK
jgi:predicted CXXCH cytochrome family protein